MKFLVIAIALTGSMTGCGGGGNDGAGGSSQTVVSEPGSTANTSNTQSGGDGENEFDFGPDTGVLAPEYSNGFRIDSLTDSGFTATYEYNLDQNTIQLVVGAMSFGDFTLDQYNRVVSSELPNFNETYRVFYNGAGLVSQVERFDSVGPIANEDTPDNRQTLHYNESRQLIRIENDFGSGPGATLELTYNGTQISNAVSNGTSLNFSVDDNGNVTSATNRLGDRIVRVFDGDGNLESFSVFEESGELRFQEGYQYSPTGSDVQNIGLMLRAVDPFSQYTLF